MKPDLVFALAIGLFYILAGYGLHYSYRLRSNMQRVVRKYWYALAVGWALLVFFPGPAADALNAAIALVGLFISAPILIVEMRKVLWSDLMAKESDNSGARITEIPLDPSTFRSAVDIMHDPPKMPDLHQ